MAKIIFWDNDYFDEIKLKKDDLILIEKTLRREAVRKWNLSCKRRFPKTGKVNDKLESKLESQADILMCVSNFFRLMQEYEK